MSNKFYLNGIQFTSECINWDELQTKIRRDDSLNHLLVLHEMNLQFSGEAYTFLYDILNNEGFCERLDFLHDDICGFTIRGVIFVSDITFNERTCIANVKLEDNSYYSYLKNNKKLKTSLNYTKSKNEVVIPAAPLYMVDIFSVIGNYAFRNVPCYRVFEAFKYLVSFMSDNKLRFKSSLFDIGGEYEGLCIVDGAKLRGAQGELKTSFDELFTEMNNRFNLILYVNDSFSASPEICIELNTDSFISGVTYRHKNPYEVLTSCEVDRLYNRVTIGNSKLVEDTPPFSFPETIDYAGWKQQEFFILGKCNIDNELNLETNYACSSNRIQKTAGDPAGAIGTSDDADDDVFLLDTILYDPGSGRTTNDDFLNVGLFYYNKRLTTNEILERYIGGIPSSIAAYLNIPGDGVFFANAVNTVVAGGYLLQQAQFPTVVTNVGGYYNNALSRYVAPNGGVYNFSTSLYISLTGLSMNVVIRVYAYHRDSAGNILQSKLLLSPPYLSGVGYFPAPDTFHNLGIASFRFVMNASEYVEIWYEIDNLIGWSGTIQADSFFSCDSNTLSGGIYNTYDPQDYPIYLYEYEYPVSSEEFKYIVQNKIRPIEIENENGIRKGWIKEISYDHNKAIAKIKLISKTNAI